MRIAFQGTLGAYSEAAALKAWPGSEVIACDRFEQVFASVAEGRASHGLLPIENSIGGSIHINYDLLLQHDLPIVAETELTVVHNLLALPGTKLPAIRRVFSHPQALAQCEQYLAGLAGVEILAVYDTAGGAKMVADGARGDAAAVASRRAAEVFGLDILAEGLQDYVANITRFVVVGRTPAGAADATKTSIVFSLKSTPGALFKALSGFALRDLNLSKLESRPIRGRPWEYLFYADVDAPRSDLACGLAISQLGEFSTWVRVLGSYRAAARGGAVEPDTPPPTPAASALTLSAAGAPGHARSPGSAPS
jgi:arogenate/prephenate dehydratase